MSVEKTENPTRKASGLDAFFHITERGSSIGQEIRGGLVTFFAMAYILVVNASILSAAAPKGIDPASIAAGTALVAGVMTILMGVVANFPMGLAAGMGLNAIVAFTLANPHALGLTYAEAMGLIFWEGVAITILVLTGFREAVFKAVPAHLKTAISVGIGLFICFVGLINAGIIRPGGTYVQLGVNGSLIGWPALVFVFGSVVIIVLYLRNVQGAILIGIAVSTVLAVIVQAVSHLGIRGTDAAGNTVHVNGWATNIPALEGSPIQLPHFATLGTIDFFGAFRVPVRSCSSTRSPRSLVVWAASRRTRRTSSRPPASPRAPAPAWRRSSPVSCSSCRCLSRRSSNWFPPRPRRFRLCSSASS